MVLGFTNENDIVLDPFIGSGTTFESCIKHDRFCVGFEMMPEYCEIAKKRIQRATSQLDLFSLEKVRISG
jgi:adenine-specific DNA-methyltransferase